MSLKFHAKGARAWPVIAAGVVALLGSAAWAQTVAYPPTGPKLPKWSDMADWDSVWERGGDITWDDRIPVGQPQVPPYNDQYMQLYKEALAHPRPARRPAGGGQGGGGQGAPGATPPPNGGGQGGMPGFMTMIRPMEVQVNPHEVLIVSEGGALRRIYTDDRIHSPDTLPSGAGDSIGHWENKVLIVDTCCFNPGGALPGGGPHSDAMHITERFYSPKSNMLVDEMTVEDPKAFTKPWTTVKTFYRRPDWALLPAGAIIPGGGGGGAPGAAPGGAP